MTDTEADVNAQTVAETGLALLAVDGPEATSFLEAQSMTALAGDEIGQVRLSAFSDARGRVLATAYAWRGDSGWRLALPQDQAQWFSGCLLRFRFRTQVEIGVAETALAGLLGQWRPDAVPAWPDAGHRLAQGMFEVIGLRGARHLVAGPRDALAVLLARWHEQVPAAGPGAWTRARLRAAEPEIRAATRGTFLPQMLGLETLATVSFSKGCYPGQEVITRAQNLGRIKRRLVLLHTETAAAPGEQMDLDGTRVTVLDSAPMPDGGVLVQAVGPAPIPAALTRYLVPAPVPDSAASPSSSAS